MKVLIKHIDSIVMHDAILRLHKMSWTPSAIQFSITFYVKYFLLTRMMSNKKFPDPPPEPPPAFACPLAEDEPKLRNLFGFIIN